MLTVLLGVLAYLSVGLCFTLVAIRQNLVAKNHVTLLFFGWPVIATVLLICPVIIAAYFVCWVVAVVTTPIRMLFVGLTAEKFNNLLWRLGGGIEPVE